MEKLRADKHIRVDVDVLRDVKVLAAMNDKTNNEMIKALVKFYKENRKEEA